MAAKQIPDAIAVVERRLAEAPEDLEARGWRARLLAWSNRWAEAEAEYRRVLAAAPNDSDILVGLADVLAWQQHYEEALALLEQARQRDPARADVYTRRGRALRSLGRIGEARQAYREALALDAANADAQAALEALEEERRNEFRLGTDIELFNFAEDARSVTASLRSRLHPRWTASFAGSFQQRFGRDAGKFTASATYKLTRRDALTLGGASGRDQGVIPKGEAFFDYSHGFDLGRHGFVRGVEASYRQHWLWFRDARILALGPGLTFYLPHDWNWRFQIVVARSRFPATGAEWQTSGLTRLSFPIVRRLRGDLFYGVGAENFARVDQIGRFSARTWGGGLRYQLTARQDITGYVFYQDRSQDRRQIGFGFSYGIRF